jgi:Protein of unknown function (DUF4232)
VTAAFAAAAALVGHAVLTGGSKASRAKEASRAPLTSLPRCRTADLRLTGRFDGAGTGQVRDTFTFTNVSAARCTLRGWPSIRVRLRSGRWAQTRRWSGNEDGGPVPHRQVVLAPGGAASFEVLSSDGVGLSRPCRSVHDLRVAPPGARTALPIGYVLGYCEGDQRGAGRRRPC